MPLGLDLDNLLGDLTGAIDGLLGDGVGDLVDGLAPGDLIPDLGDTLNDLLSGGVPTGLLEDLLDNGLLDLGLLQEIIGGAAPGDLNLDSLNDLLGSVDPDDLGSLLDDVFDTPLIGVLGTVVDSDVVAGLSPTDLESVIRYVTSLVGSIVEVTGDPADVNALLNTLLLGDDNLSGDDDPNRISGVAGNDTIQGQGGNDSLYGGNGEDSVLGGEGNDVVDGGEGNDKLYGGAGNDLLKGQSGNDSLYGGDGGDRMDGGLGVDRMEGNAGNDVYTVNDSRDVVVEAAGGGNDLVRATQSFTLGDNVERLYLLGQGDLSGTGNELNNRIDGSLGDNRIDGAAGNDTIFGNDGVDQLTGGSGNDTFRFTAADQSGVGSGNRDIVTDFGDGDKIKILALDGDLSADGNQAFQFVGRSDFVANGKGQVGFDVGSSFTVVHFDVDGDGGVDFQLQLTGLHQLTASDFVL